MVDNLVVDQEEVTRTFADRIGEIDVLAISNRKWKDREGMVQDWLPETYPECRQEPV